MQRLQTGYRPVRKNSLARWTLGIVLWLWLTVFVLMLAGCASRPTEQVLVSAPCPEPTALPASVTESSLPDARDFSARVQNWLEKVRDYLSGLPETKGSQE